MPVMSRSTATGPARGRAAAAAAPPPAAANGDAGAGAPVPNREMQRHNERIGLSFRKKVAAYANTHRTGQRIVQSYAESFGDSQVTVQIVEDVATGKKGLVEFWGETKNTPRCLRMKRTAADALAENNNDEEEEDGDGGVGHGDYDDAERNGGDREMANEWTEEERREAARLAARKKKAAAAASSAKKQKKSSSSSSRRQDGSSRSREPVAPAANASADANGTARRSSRVTRSTRPSSGSNVREPIIREDEEENHVRNDIDAADGEAPHHIDEYHLRRSTRAASDDLNSLSDRMNMFEIKSEAGSESTRVFSRESSLAEPVASTSRL